MSELWPMSFVERAKGWLDGSDVLLPEHILDYAYPVGSKKRYTAVGWEIWKRIAIRDGIPIPADELERE